MTRKPLAILAISLGSRPSTQAVRRSAGVIFGSALCHAAKPLSRDGRRQGLGVLPRLACLLLGHPLVVAGHDAIEGAALVPTFELLRPVNGHRVRPMLANEDPDECLADLVHPILIGPRLL